MSGDQVGLALAEQRRRQIPLGLLAMHSGLLTSAEVHHVLRAQTHRRAWKRFGEVATEMGLLDDSATESLLARQRRTRPRLGAILVEQGAVEPDDLSTLVDRHHNLSRGSEIGPPSWDRAV
ncbi:MAG: hypothetical protein GY898_12780 [Proteobacteria bacterium]|nr:hypothetical protein [Pseudomonadota bacterium]